MQTLVEKRTSSSSHDIYSLVYLSIILWYFNSSLSLSFLLHARSGPHDNRPYHRAYTSVYDSVKMDFSQEDILRRKNEMIQRFNTEHVLSITRQCSSRILSRRRRVDRIYILIEPRSDVLLLFAPALPPFFFPSSLLFGNDHNTTNSLQINNTHILEESTTLTLYRRRRLEGSQATVLR